MIIVPFTSVGNLFFNDSRKVIREKINAPFTVGRRGQDDDEFNDFYDYFEGGGLFVYYDKNDKLNAFEFFDPNPIFRGVDLLREPFDRIVDFFKEIDPNLVSGDSFEFRSDTYGIGGTCSNNDDSDCPEAIIIYRKGYYDLLDAYLEELNKG